MSEKQTTTWYQIKKWDVKVFPVEVESETEKTLVVRGRREYKKTEWGQYFPTHDEAVGGLYRRARVKLDNAWHTLNQAEQELDKLRSQYPEPGSEGGA